MTLRLLLGCNLVNLLDIRLVTLLWLVAGVVVTTVAVAVQVACFLLQLLYLRVRHIPLRLVLVGLEHLQVQYKVVLDQIQ
jgi:hypothetical protein